MGARAWVQMQVRVRVRVGFGRGCSHGENGFALLAAARTEWLANTRYPLLLTQSPKISASFDHDKPDVSISMGPVTPFPFQHPA